MPEMWSSRGHGVYFALEESQPEWESDLEDIQRRAEARATMFDGVLQQVEQTPDSLGAVGMEAAQCAGSATADC